MDIRKLFFLIKRDPVLFMDMLETCEKKTALNVEDRTHLRRLLEQTSSYAFISGRNFRSPLEMAELFTIKSLRACAWARVYGQEGDQPDDEGAERVYLKNAGDFYELAKGYFKVMSEDILG